MIHAKLSYRFIHRLRRVATTVLLIASTLPPHAQAFQTNQSTPLRVEPEAVPDIESSTRPFQPKASLSNNKFRVDLPHVVVEQALAADTEMVGIPFQIGFARPVTALQNSSDTYKALTWTTAPDGSHATAVNISSPSAKALRLGLRVFALPTDASIRIFDAGTVSTHEITGQEILDLISLNKKSGDVTESAHIWWSPVSNGTEISLEIVLPPSIDTQEVQVAVPLISELFLVPERASDIGKALTCQNDVSCYPSWDTLSRATAHMVFTENGVSFMCSGTLMNDRDPLTSIPYFLSANHCFSTQTVASTLQTYWFFHSSSCNSGAVNSAYKIISGGATLLYTSSDTDTAFMKLNNPAPPGAFLAGWSSEPVSLNSIVTGVHHPRGDLQKISFGNLSAFQSCSDIPGTKNFRCLPVNSPSANHYEVVWNSGATEVGSSGSGLFNTNGYLIATLHGAPPKNTCSGAISYYGRFDLALKSKIGEYLNKTTSASYQLTVGTLGTGAGTVTGSGINCGSDCLQSFPANTQVILTATPSVNSTFIGWEGACSGTATTCSVIITADTNVLARFQQVNQMTLKDAIYLYNQPIYSNKFKVPMGYNCDVFQMLLDVKTGYSDLEIFETDVTVYPDRILNNAAMFAYSLYSAEPVKGFALWDNTPGVADKQIGTATFFGYCFSTKSDAFVVMYDDYNQTCRYSDNTVVDCSGYASSVPAPLKSPTPTQQGAPRLESDIFVPNFGILRNKLNK